MNKHQISFKNKPWQQGNSWVVTIPMDYIDNGLIPTEQEGQWTYEPTKIQPEPEKEDPQK